MATSQTPRQEIGTLLVLGASGDLTQRLLLPGLAALLADREEARGAPIRLLGAGREQLSERQWRDRVRHAFADSGAGGSRAEAVADATEYRSGDVTDPELLQELLAECEGTPALYFALPPAVTERACRALTRVRLPPGTMLVMEKPFGGGGVEGAKHLNQLVTSLVPENQVFRVDHFLGRADTLNILGLRFANRLLEPIWNRDNVERIDIVYDEDLTLEGRAGYYDHAGAMVDMLQSHLLQVMAMVMMEPVSSLDERGFRAAKTEVLRATELAGPVAECTRRARYTAGSIGDRKVPAYTREQGVDPKRRTETLAEVTVTVQNWRWAGVPVTLRSGKALGTPRKQAVVTLKPVPHLPRGLTGAETPDTITIGFKPPGVGFHLDVNGPGDSFELDDTTLHADLAQGDLTAYGEVLAGVLDGDPTLAVRGDTAEECWRIVAPVTTAWREEEVPMDTYPAGSDGPRGWRR